MRSTLSINACSVLQGESLCDAVCCSVLEGRRTLCRMRFILSISTYILLQCVAVCCSVLQLSREARNAMQHDLLCPLTPLPLAVCVAVCCSVLQCVAVCCSSMLQQHVAAVCCSSVLWQRVAAVCCSSML